MTSRTVVDKIIEDYIGRLDKALESLPPFRRSPIMEDIARHIARSRAELLDQTEVEIRALLDRIGDPEIIAIEAGATVTPKRPSPSDVLVPWLLLLGGFVFLIGWIVGIIFLWTSATWTLRQKLLGTLVLPGGLVPLVYLVARSTTVCTGNKGVAVHSCVTTGYMFPVALGIVMVVIALLAPISMAIYLDRVRRQASIGV